MSREVCMYELYTAFSFSFLFSFLHSAAILSTLHAKYFPIHLPRVFFFGHRFHHFVFPRFSQPPCARHYHRRRSKSRRRTRNGATGTRRGNGRRELWNGEQDENGERGRTTCGERRREGRFYSRPAVPRRFIERCTHSRCYTFTALPRGAWHANNIKAQTGVEGSEQETHKASRCSLSGRGA